MNAEIIAVGTELLLGQILNTNARFLSRQLSSLGINIYFQTVVGDNAGRLGETLNIALSRADIIILTGGLGPTKDDLTKETVAQVLGLKLIPDDESMKNIEQYFKKLNIEMTLNNKKQGYFPEGCKILYNGNGTAPGCLIEKDGKTVIMFPGPPQEMEPMFKKHIYPYFKEKYCDSIIHSKVLRIFGIGESSLVDKISDIIDNQTNPTVAPYAKQGEVTLRLTSRGEDQKTAENLIYPVEKQIRDRLGIAVYGEDEQSLEEVVCNLLVEKNITIATAESCTGGLIAGKITSIPGISKCFLRGFVTYSNEAKEEMLGVSHETLEKYGAVSYQTAVEMAKGARERSKTDIAVSVTGIAGPGGGSEEKPVGLVYIGISSKEKTDYKELRLAGTRDKIRNLTVMHALNMVRTYILQMQ